MPERTSTPPEIPLGGEANTARLRSAAGIWLIAISLCVVLVALSLALWRAEVRIDSGLPGRSPTWVLWGGLAISVLMTAAVLQTLLHRAKAQEQTQRHLEAIESLNAISTAISAQIGSGTPFDELARAAARLLGMSRSGVCVFDPLRRTLEVVAAAGDMPASFPRVFDIDRLPICKNCLKTNTVYFARDIRAIARPYSLEVAATFGVVSLILIPLLIENRPIGMLTLCSSDPKKFTELERRIAGLLGSQASVILSNTRLFEQTRRDAETKAVLLRELNHRVKNNLTGIVALLEMHPPKMPSDVRLWLDRAVDRIRAMARAHQLLIGGRDRVRLDSLVAQTLSALSVSKPAGVTIHADLDNVQVTLGPQQSIGLALVLHELCYNALVHGVRDGGTLTIRARRENDGGAAQQSGPHVVIEVADDGTGCWEADSAHEGICVPTDRLASSAGSGQGLMLVEGLIQRELRGTFNLGARSGGGTVAKVKFPFGGDLA